MERIPIWLLTGFLGSGKTTLLNRLLSVDGMRDTAVIVNEFGSIPIDHHLVATATEHIIVLGNGCLCCALRGDLSDALRELFIQRMQGQLPAFSRVVIETTGLADPAPAIHTLVSDLVLVDRYRFEGVITVVDPHTIARQLDQYREARSQVELADELVISKTDLPGFDPVRVEGLLRLHNPLAAITVADPANDLGDVFRRHGAAWSHPANAIETEGRYLGRPLQRHPVGIGSMAFEVAHAPLVWERFSQFLGRLQGAQGESILRVKGILWIEGEPQAVVVQCVQHVFYPVERLAHWPEGRALSRLVIIGRGLAHGDVLEGQLRQCAVSAPGGG